MANETKLITVKEVIDQALKTATFDEELLQDFIIPAQREYLKTMLGKDYYDDLITKYEAQTLAAEDDLLLEDFLRPMLAHYVIYDALPTIQMNVTSAGIMKNSTDSSEAASSGEVAHLRSNILRMAEVWKKHAIEYVKEQQDLDTSAYALYDACKDSKTNKYGFIF
jgi:hypothetical protein